MSNRIYLSRRNLLTLLSKLDRAAKGDETARTIWKRDNVHTKYPSKAMEVIAIEDEDYYTDRNPGPTQELGIMADHIPWLKAIDEAMIVLHMGVANASDSYAVAEKKLAALIEQEIKIATDPAVNGSEFLISGEKLRDFMMDFVDTSALAERYKQLTSRSWPVVETHESVIEDAYKDHTS